MKKAVVIVAGILAILFVISFAKDAIVKISVEKGVEAITGLPLNIKSFRVGIIKTLVGIRNLRLFNPKGYEDKIMLDMPEIYVDYDLPAIFKGKVHLEEMRINMKEFAVVKNRNGELNLDSLKVVRAQKEGRAPAPEEKEISKAPEIQIDSLKLKIGKVIYKDYSRGGNPLVKEFNVNLDEKYENITDPYSLVSLIVVKSLMNTTIAGLADFDLQNLKGTISDTLATAEKAAAEAATRVQETIKQTQEDAGRTVTLLKEKTQKSVEDATKETQKAIQKTTQNLKEKLKLPFGE